MALTDSTPGKANMKIKTGDTWKRVFRINLNDGNATPVNLAGSTILMQLRKRPGSPIIKQLQIGSGLTIAGVANNEIHLQTLADFIGKYKYELQITFPNGTIKTYLQGSIDSKIDITV